jgi:hypothetical protein
MEISRDESLQNALARERKFGEAIKVAARNCTDGTLDTSLTLDLWIGSSYAVDFEVRSRLSVVHCSVCVSFTHEKANTRNVSELIIYSH